mmetsp:Transcript_23189/g.25756  ORF Transcript_23189/g.25756 Transcript_23189/m.25756 type:complete len:166 (-) Transcript_23189:153-650(-)
MFDDYLRSGKDAVFLPIAKLFSAFHPIYITLFALVIGIASAYAAAFKWYTLALVLWLLNRILDGLDGAVARFSDTQSDFGGYLDIVCDFIVYAYLPVGLAYSAQSNDLWLVLSFMEGAFFINAGAWMYLSAILEKRNSGASTTGELTTITMPRGLVGGFETIVFF